MRTIETSSSRRPRTSKATRNLVTAVALGLLATVSALTPRAWSQDLRLDYEFSVRPGQGGQPAIQGFPTQAVASLDGRHLYVVTSPPSNLSVYERVEDSLILRDTIDEFDGGFFPGQGGIAISDDGELVYVGAGPSPAVLVYARESTTGLLTPVQTLELPDLQFIDGVTAGPGRVLIWGVTLNSQGTVYVARRSGSTSSVRGRVASSVSMPVGDIETLFEASDRIVDAIALSSRDGTPIDLAVSKNGTLLISKGLELRTTVRLAQLLPSQVLPSEPKSIGYFPPTNSSFGVGVELEDGSSVQLGYDLESCSITSGAVSENRSFPLEVIAITKVVNGQNLTILVSKFFEGGASAETRAAGGVTDETAIVDDELGRPFDATAAGLQPDPAASPLQDHPQRSSEGSSVGAPAGNAIRVSAPVYAIIPNPPEIRAYRISDVVDPDAVGCIPSATTACLNGFETSVTYTDFEGGAGDAQVVAGGTSDSGLFWFFDPDNWEMLVKVLDACGVNGHYWVFSAATTNAGYTLTVAAPGDSGTTRTYENPLGVTANALVDTSAIPCNAEQVRAAELRARRDPAGFASALRDLETSLTGLRADHAGNAPILPLTLPLPSGADCTDDDTTLCLTPDRFRVEITWSDFEGNGGDAGVAPLRSTDSGLFYFFDADNWEVLVKVLDACGVNQRYWVLAAATTNLEYQLTITDTVTGETFRADNAAGSAAPAVIDTNAFASVCGEGG